MFSEAIDTLGFFDAGGLANINSFIDNYTNYGSRTTLYGACQVGINMLDAFSQKGVKTLIVFTDGGDNNTNNPQSVLSSIQSNSYPKYAIGLDGKDFRKDNLKQIASSSDNLFVAKNISDLKTAFDEVSNLVSTIYKFSYLRSKQTLDPSGIKIKFEFNVEKLN